jgi:acyl-CoA thioesterase-1
MNTTLKKALYGVIIILLSLVMARIFFVSRNPETVSTIKNTQGSQSSPVFTIVTFGDSLTAGYGVTLEESYPFILEKSLRQLFPEKSITVINMGASGETSTGGLERVSFVISQKPSVVLLGLGANDMLRGTPPSVTRSNLEAMMQAFKKENIDVILLGMQASAATGASYKEAFNAIYPQLSQKYATPLVPFFLDGVALKPSLTIDDGSILMLQERKERKSSNSSLNLEKSLL